MEIKALLKELFVQEGVRRLFLELDFAERNELVRLETADVVRQIFPLDDKAVADSATQRDEYLDYRRLAHTAWRVIDTDCVTPDAFLARLALDDFGGASRHHPNGLARRVHYLDGAKKKRYQVNSTKRVA
jgi:hypothetical protein